MRASLLLMCLGLTVGCKESNADKIRDQWSEWRALGISDYSFIWRPDCYCDVGDLQGTRVEVRAGAVTAAVGVGEGRPDPYRSQTMDALFKDALELAERDPDELSMDFDAMAHFLSSFAVDPERDTTDDEYGFRIRCFSRDPDAGCPVAWLTREECTARAGTPTSFIPHHSCASPADVLGPISDADSQVCCLHPRPW